MRPLSSFNFPNIVPVLRILRLGRWTRSPSGGQAFAFMPSHPFRFFPESWRRLLRKEQTLLWWLLSGLRDRGSLGYCLFWPLSKSGELFSVSVAAFREKGKQAGFSARAADFSAEALRESTRVSYNSNFGMLLQVV